MMKPIIWLLSLILCVTLVAPALGGDAEDGDGDAPRKEKKDRKHQEKKARPGLQGEFRALAEELGLSAEQKEQLAAVLKEFGQKQRALATEQMEAQKQLREQTRQARKDGDKARLEELSQQRDAMRAKHRELGQQRQAAIAAILTPEQQVKWHAHQVFAVVMGGFPGLELTGDQKDALRKLCAEAGPSWAAAEDDQARRAIVAELREKAAAGILTDEQKAKFEARKQRGKRDGDRKKDGPERKQRDKQKKQRREKPKDGDDVQAPSPVDEEDQG